MSTSIGSEKSDTQLFVSSLDFVCIRCGAHPAIYQTMPIPLARCLICFQHYYFPVMVSFEEDEEIEQ